MIAGVPNLDKKASSLPPPPPVYGHSIEKFVDPNEEKKNFMQILQKAQISYQNHQVPNSARTPSVDGITSFNQKPGIKIVMILSTYINGNFFIFSLIERV